MVLNAAFNNISVILRWSVLLAEETGEPRVLVYMNFNLLPF
jgi:hypothetical protein